MEWFPGSLTDLREELTQLEAAVTARANELAAARTPADRYAGELLPLTSQVVGLRAKIRARTPWPELAARRDQLNEELQSLDAFDPRLLQIQREASDLDDYLRGNTRRRPMSAKTLVAFVAIVLAAMYLPQLIVEWLAP